MRGNRRRKLGNNNGLVWQHAALGLGSANMYAASSRPGPFLSRRHHPLPCGSLSNGPARASVLFQLHPRLDGRNGRPLATGGRGSGSWGGALEGWVCPREL